MTESTTTDTSALLAAMVNLSTFHREHERFYASAPRELAVRLQRHARALLALADTWSIAVPSSRVAYSPYEGADDLNSPAAIQLDGVLFMEGDGPPAELIALVRALRHVAQDQRETGQWLATAMQASWAMVSTLIHIDGLADLLGERHRIIANDWQAAHLNDLISHLLDRAADILEAVDFAPDALRADLSKGKASAGRVYAAAELISHAADLCSDSAGLVHDNERRWRTFHQRVVELTAAEG
jgi:hypothetical protein